MDTAWWRLEMAAPADLEESLLWRLEALGVFRLAVRHRPETPAERELVAWLPQGEWPAPERAVLDRALQGLGEPFGLAVPPIRWHRQSDEDWSLSWKRNWRPDPVGRRLLILPAWLEPPPEHADRLLIRMDPGSAFGTGSHPTTRLCLEALEELALGRSAESGGSLAGLRVADLGCGSGILALAALRLGADAAAAADTDSLAVSATAANAALNGVTSLRVGLGSLETLAELLENRPADVLLCNILAPVIEDLCPGFQRLLAPGGVGFLSGLLVDQAPALERALAGAGWQAELLARQDPWGLITIRAIEPNGIPVA